MNRKTARRYVDEGFGFPVVLLQVPMIKIRGSWTPEINYDLLTKAVLRGLILLPGRLTGDQVQFVRRHFEMTLQQFATRFGLTHPAVLKWEKTAENPTGMNWSTEKDIRLFIANRLCVQPREFKSIYDELEKTAPVGSGKIELDSQTLAA